MQVGFIGLGKMGIQMVERLIADNHELFVFDKQQLALNKAEHKGAKQSTSIDDLCSKFSQKLQILKR